MIFMIRSATPAGATTWTLDWNIHGSDPQTMPIILGWVDFASPHHIGLQEMCGGYWRDFALELLNRQQGWNVYTMGEGGTCPGGEIYGNGIFSLGGCSGTPCWAFHVYYEQNPVGGGDGGIPQGSFRHYICGIYPGRFVCSTHLSNAANWGSQYARAQMTEFRETMDIAKVYLGLRSIGMGDFNLTPAGDGVYNDWGLDANGNGSTWLEGAPRQDNGSGPAATHNSGAHLDYVMYKNDDYCRATPYGAIDYGIGASDHYMIVSSKNLGC
jgi:hypothetical protein